MHLKMIPKGVSQHSEIRKDITKWKMDILKFGHF